MYKIIHPLDYFSNQLISIVEILTRLSQWPVLVKIIFQISHPKTSSQRSSKNTHVSSSGGRAFQDTLIGSLLAKSCLHAHPGKPFVFFDKPKTMNERDVELTASTMWQPMQIYQETLTQLFKAFVKNADVRNDVLEWIGDCFYENQGREFVG